MDKACPDWHASALNFSFSHCMSLLNFISEFLECFGKVDACQSGQTVVAIVFPIRSTLADDRKRLKQTT
jgi:hypothetical protein